MWELWGFKSWWCVFTIDPTYPIDRIKYILQDSQTEILLTQDKLINLVDCTEVDDISIIKIHNEHLFKYGTENLRIDSSSKDLVLCHLYIWFYWKAKRSYGGASFIGELM